MNKKKMCSFYVNDVHLVTMLLPYINERINGTTEIITILETDMSRSANKVIEMIQGKKSERLLNIDWKQKSLSYLQEVNLENKLILVCGSNEFINEANKIIDNKKEKCEVLNCYEMVQGSLKLQEILDKHEKVVNTKGENYPENVFKGYVSSNYNEITI